MDILENDIEDIIFDMFKESSDRIKDFGCDSGLILRQPTLGAYGRLDLLNIEFEGSDWENNPDRHGEYIYIRNWTVNIIELKRNKISYCELGQIARYVTGVRRLINYLRVDNRKVKNRIKVKGILIGKQLDESSDFVFLLNKLMDISVFTYSLDYKKGLKFTKPGYYVKLDEDFSKVFDQLQTEDLKMIIKDFYKQRFEEQGELNGGL